MSTLKSVSQAPICLIRNTEEKFHVEHEGIQVLHSISEPIAVVCLAGQYRTGKSFFLNKLAKNEHETSAPHMAPGFQVGSTTESCTRGIWIWSPSPAIRTKNGDRVIFMDTEGLAATDNDETFDAKIFSLGLLLSSLFIFNTMGVIDEAAIDRLYLVSELTKHICVSTRPVQEGDPDDSVHKGSKDELELPEDTLRELASYFPPFVWLLRDFILEMKDGNGDALSPNEYLEKQLESRQGNTRRLEERNRIRDCIRILFSSRECMTLVRPVLDEVQLRNAAALPETCLRPEFTKQMEQIRSHLLENVRPKRVLNKIVDGRMLALLVEKYTATMNSGSIPDIKAAWQYVSESSCQNALSDAIECYSSAMLCSDDPNDSGQAIFSRQEFDNKHKIAMDKAVQLYKSQSVEGSLRASCFQQLKQHMQKQRADLLAELHDRSSLFCSSVLANLSAPLMEKILSEAEMSVLCKNDDANQSAYSNLLCEIDEEYEKKARGPAKELVFGHFLRRDCAAFFDKVIVKLKASAANMEREKNDALENFKEVMDGKVCSLQQRIQEKDQDIRHLKETKGHLEEKIALHMSTITELQRQLEIQKLEAEKLEEKQKSLKVSLEESQTSRHQLEKDNAKVCVEAEQITQQLHKCESDLDTLRKCMTEERHQMAITHSHEQDKLIQSLTEERAEKLASQLLVQQLQSTLKSSEHNCTRLREALEHTDQKLRDSQVAIAQRDNEHSQLHALASRLQAQLNGSEEHNVKLKSKLQSTQNELLSQTHQFKSKLQNQQEKNEIEMVLHECVHKVAWASNTEKMRVLLEERAELRAELGELLLKVTSLPEFYQRRIFCPAKPVPSFFEALTS